LKAVGTDLARHWAQLKRLRLPGGEAETPLASAVHGLGLLAALAMGASGAWLFTQAVPGGLVLETHKLVSNLMWAYVVGHAGLALLHQASGHRVLQRMLS
jgi:cytochrome b561